MKQKSEFKQAEIGMIPNGWERIKLSEAIEINPKRKLKKGSSAKKVSMDCLSAFNKKIQNFEISPFAGGSKFTNNDTLMARITPCLENGKTAFVDILEEEEIGFGSTEFIILTGKKGKTTNDFVYYLSISPQLRKEAIKSMTGTSGRQRVQTDLFGEVTINLPEVMEQKFIAKILSNLDSKIELNHQMNKTLEAVGQAIFKHWFVDFEFPNEEGKPYKSSGGELVDSELGKIPKGWEVKDVYSFADVVYGAPFASNMFNENGEGLPLVRIRDLKTATPQFYTTEKHPKATIIQPGDIIIGMDAEFRPTIWIGEQAYLNQRLFLAKPNRDCVAKFYVYEALKPHLTFFENSKVGTTVIHLSKTDIESFKFSTPPDNLLNQFKSFIEKIHRKIVVNAQQSLVLLRIRDSLLPKLMSGKIRVPIEVRL